MLLTKHSFDHAKLNIAGYESAEIIALTLIPEM